jgi:hypothetical protein
MQATLVRVEQKIDKVLERETAQDVSIAQLGARQKINAWIIGLLAGGIITGSVALFWQVVKVA